MAAVDFDLKFTYVLARWEGFAHDALVLADAIERDGGLSVPEGNKFTHSQISQIVLKPLCSVLYANPPLPCWEILSSGCWLCLQTRVPASIQGVRYNLSKYGPSHNPTNAKKLYNLPHLVL